MFEQKNFGGEKELHNMDDQDVSTHIEYQARLAQSVEHETLNLRVVGSSPTLGATQFCPTS